MILFVFNFGYWFISHIVETFKNNHVNISTQENVVNHTPNLMPEKDSGIHAIRLLLSFPESAGDRGVRIKQNLHINDV